VVRGSWRMRKAGRQKVLTELVDDDERRDLPVSK
jgi:hypothetical protein